MKKILIAITIFCYSLAIAQEKPKSIIEISGSNFDLEQHQKSLSSIENLATTKFLSDRAYPLVNFEYFNGDKNSKVIDSDYLWKNLNQQVEDSQLKNANIYLRPSLQLSKTEYKRRGSSNEDEFIEATPISITDINYNSIKKDAFDKKQLLIRPNGNVYRPARRGTKTVNEDVFNKKNLFFSRSLNTKFYNGNKIDFIFDKRFLNTNKVNENNEFEIDFNDGIGFRKITFGKRISVSYNSTGKKTVTIRKKTVNNPEVKVSKFNINVKRLSTPRPSKIENISRYIPSNYKHGGVNVSGKAYFYGNYPPKNPIIVPEGFDPENTRNWNGLYNIINQKNFAENLKSNGFDLIVLNFNKGGTYIERNAFLLKELIKRVNAIKTTDNKNVIIGPSMGGLISRYALAYMEKNGVDHDTKLYASFDAPQTGANIPVGVQSWVKFFAKLSNEAKHKYNNVLNSIAAQQMLIYHVNNNNGYLNNNPKRVDFVNSLNSVGYPKELRKIAVSNGSGNATKLGFSPSSQLIKYKYRSFWTVDIDGNSYALPNQNENLVFYGNLQFSWAAEIKGYRDAKFTHRVKGTYPYDNAAGGTTNTMDEIANSSTDGRGDIVAKHSNHCFIPTSSAFGSYSFNQNFATGNYYTPFDKIYFPVNKNEEHVHISSDFIKWISNELVPEKIVSNKDSRETWNKGEVRASKEIVLKPGFEVKAGTTMRAFIKPLSLKGNYYSRNSSEITVNSEETNIKTFNNVKESNENEKIIIYPNPSSSLFNIKTSVNIEQWQVNTIYGKTVLKGIGNVQTINGNKLTRGIYTFKAVLVDGTVVTNKLIKK